MEMWALRDAACLSWPSLGFVGWFLVSHPIFAFFSSYWKMEWGNMAWGNMEVVKMKSVKLDRG